MDYLLCSECYAIQKKYEDRLYNLGRLDARTLEMYRKQGGIALSQWKVSESKLCNGCRRERKDLDE